MFPRGGSEKLARGENMLEDWLCACEAKDSIGRTDPCVSLRPREMSVCPFDFPS